MVNEAELKSLMAKTPGGNSRPYRVLLDETSRHDDAT